MSGTTGLMGAVGWQLLGNGHRVYNPVLMRFHSPDRLSPFGRGGINAYAYCGGDPINLADPSGRFAVSLAMMGLAVVGGVGGFAAANPSGRGGENGGVNPWIIGGVIAAVGVLAGVGMAGRQGKSWAKIAGGTHSGVPSASVTPSAATSSSAVTQVQTKGRDGSDLYQLDPEKIFTNGNGDPSIRIEDLDPKVIERIEQIRQYSHYGLTPDPSKVPRGDRFSNHEGVLPVRRNQKNMYWKYPIGDDPTTGRFARTRLVVSRGNSADGGRPRIGGMRITTEHYRNFVVISGWERYRAR